MKRVKKNINILSKFLWMVCKLYLMSLVIECDYVFSIRIFIVMDSVI